MSYVLIFLIGYVAGGALATLILFNLFIEREDRNKGE